MPSIVTVDTSAVVCDEPIAADRLIAGQPKSGLRAAHDDEGLGFYSGVWASEVGAWRVAYDEAELCVILAGRVRLTEDGGAACEYGPGEAFVVPRGFTGVWETLEPCRKIYAIATGA